MEKYLDPPVVEINSVEETKGEKTLLTIHSIKVQFILAFLRNANTSQSIIDIFDKLYLELRPSRFMELFPVILTENQTEFSNQAAIEFDRRGNRQLHIFYCDPFAPY